MSRSLIFALLIPAIFGCNPEDPCSAAATVEPSLRVGLGEKEYQPLRDGDALPLTWGNQGGRHVWVAVHTEGVPPGGGAFNKVDPPDFLFALEDQDGLPVGSGSMSARPLDGDETGAELAGMRVYIDVYSYDQAPARRDLTLTATAWDACGLELTDSVDVWAEL